MFLPTKWATITFTVEDHSNNPMQVESAVPHGDELPGKGSLDVLSKLLNAHVGFEVVAVQTGREKILRRRSTTLGARGSMVNGGGLFPTVPTQAITFADSSYPLSFTDTGQNIRP